jgi:CRP-like cAMP-binding protein
MCSGRSNAAGCVRLARCTERRDRRRHTHRLCRPPASKLDRRRDRFGDFLRRPRLKQGLPEWQQLRRGLDFEFLKREYLGLLQLLSSLYPGLTGDAIFGEKSLRLCAWVPRKQTVRWRAFAPGDGVLQGVTELGRRTAGSSYDTGLLRSLKMVAAPETNGLLAALPAMELERWVPMLELVEMPLGAVLYESGQIQSHVFFPTTAIVSLLYVMENGASAEIAIVGNEGLVGIALFMGGETTPSRAVVQSAGQGFRLNAHSFKDEIGQAPVLHLLLRYSQALITQMTQTAVCNRHHSLDQQLCRWLLLSLDRLQGNELLMTQELISNMLGVRRGGVNESAHKLQDAGLIRYTRGRIKVLDRKGLEDRTCECYAVVKKEYERLLPTQIAE